MSIEGISMQPLVKEDEASFIELPELEPSQVRTPTDIEIGLSVSLNTSISGESVRLDTPVSYAIPRLTFGYFMESGIGYGHSQSHL